MTSSILSYDTLSWANNPRLHNLTRSVTMLLTSALATYANPSQNPHSISCQSRDLGLDKIFFTCPCTEAKMGYLCSPKVKRTKTLVVNLGHGPFV